MSDPSIVSGAVEAVVTCVISGAVGVIVGNVTARRNGKNGNGKPTHCLEHYKIVEDIAVVRTKVEAMFDDFNHVYAHKLRRKLESRGGP